MSRCSTTRLRQLAALWANFQTAMAAWDRISQILGLEY
jgi:ATP-binding cassette subfamily B protein